MLNSRRRVALSHFAATGRRLTVCPEDQSRWRAVNFALGDAIHHHTRVVAHVGGLHLGNVEVSRLLGHKAPIVLLNKVRVLVENPCISEVCKTNEGEHYSGSQM